MGLFVSAGECWRRFLVLGDVVWVCRVAGGEVRRVRGKKGMWGFEVVVVN